MSTPERSPQTAALVPLGTPLAEAPRHAEPLLSARSLTVTYGVVPAVTDVSLSVLPGEIVTVIGANGAGKSSLLNALAGIVPARGAITFLDAEMGRLGVEARTRRGLALVPEKRELFASMSVIDNLVLGGFTASRAQRARTLDAVLARFPRLAERRRQIAGTMSGGERQMLAIGRALMSQPRLLMLDEPSLGLAPRIVAEIFAIIAELRKEGVAILLVEQNAKAALKAADRASVMELGRVTLDGAAADLARDPRIADIYLGG